ncbi:hypothetical protein QMZ05_12565 [Bradyrhizobium sp. INPA03-11B]|uniref:hypothetical protein n=1 Tax=Bradyrhizobium sp. INPA03-11B TaxID=418598 RepID=UPI00338D4A5A
MIGVRFKTAVAPYGAGDTALLPDSAAQAVLRSGEAERYAFPGAPHATEARVPRAKPMQPRRAQNLAQSISPEASPSDGLYSTKGTHS